MTEGKSGNFLQNGAEQSEYNGMGDWFKYV